MDRPIPALTHRLRALGLVVVRDHGPVPVAGEPDAMSKDPRVIEAYLGTGMLSRGPRQMLLTGRRLASARAVLMLDGLAPAVAGDVFERIIEIRAPRRSASYSSSSARRKP